MRTGENQTAKLLREYTALASTYDRRWSAYIAASLHMTLNKVADLPACSVLDVACGTGQLLAIIAERADNPELVGVDRVSAMLDVARHRLGRRATFIAADAAQLPFSDGHFRLLTSCNALHYFPDVNAALREFRRVISADGNLVITDWCRDHFWMKALNRLLPWTQYSHAQTFSGIELEQSLVQAGFKVRGMRRMKIDWFWSLMTVHATPV